MRKIRRIINVNRSDPGLVYIVQARRTPYFKFGETTDLKERIRRMQTECPHRIIPTFCAYTSDRFAVENALLVRFFDYKILLDWHELTDKQVLQAIALIRLAEVKSHSNITSQLPATQLTLLPQKLYTIYKLSLQEAIEQITEPQKTMNQTQLIKYYWDANKGGSKAYIEAKKQYDLIMREVKVRDDKESFS